MVKLKGQKGESAHAAYNFEHECMILPIQHSNLDARKIYSKKDANGFLDTSCMDSDMLHITKWIYHKWIRMRCL